MFFLRLVLGFGFAAHGWAKLSRGPAGFGEILDRIGVPFPHAAAWATALLEFGGGLLLIAGAFVVITGVPLIVIMLTAMFSVHLPYGFSSIKLLGITAQGAQFGPPGYEVCLLYIAGVLALIFSGPGRWSFDEWMKRRR
jgi:putative oxidoreductase